MGTCFGNKKKEEVLEPRRILPIENEKIETIQLD